MEILVPLLCLVCALTVVDCESTTAATTVNSTAESIATVNSTAESIATVNSTAESIATVNPTTEMSTTVNSTAVSIATVNPTTEMSTTETTSTGEAATVDIATMESSTPPVTASVTASMSNSEQTQMSTDAGTTEMASTAPQTTPPMTTSSMATTQNMTTMATTPMPMTTMVTTPMATTNPPIDPCLNSTVVQDCKNRNFTRCVSTGPGVYSCEGCLSGWTLKGGICRKLPKVIGRVTIKFENGQETVWTVDLTNRSSARFIQLYTACCESFVRATSAISCYISSFTQGSIIVNFELGFPENSTNINQTEIAQGILDDANNTGIGLDPNVELTVVTTFCESGTCKNDGVCYLSESVTMCNCTSQYTGSTCETAITTAATTTTVTPPDHLGLVLTTAQIVGIVLGAVALLLIIIIIIVFVVIKCSKKNKIGSHSDMESAERSKQPRGRRSRQEPEDRAQLEER